MALAAGALSLLAVACSKPPVPAPIIPGPDCIQANAQVTALGCSSAGAVFSQLCARIASPLYNGCVVGAASCPAVSACDAARAASAGTPINGR